MQARYTALDRGALGRALALAPSASQSMVMICSGVNRFLLISNSFQMPKSYHRRWNDLRGSGQAKEGKETKVKVPNLVGMCFEDAEKVITLAKLTLGEVTKKATKQKDLVGKVLDQDVEPDVYVNPKSAIGIEVGIEGDNK